MSGPAKMTELVARLGATLPNEEGVSTGTELPLPRIDRRSAPDPLGRMHGSKARAMRERIMRLHLRLGTDLDAADFTLRKDREELARAYRETAKLIEEV